MPNYKEVLAQNSVYTRCHTLIVNNPYERQPSVQFQEERVVRVDDQVFFQPMEGCRIDVTPGALITVLDPVTNLPTGETVTHERLYQLLYSAYIQTALERDSVSSREE